MCGLWTVDSWWEITRERKKDSGSDAVPSIVVVTYQIQPTYWTWSERNPFALNCVFTYSTHNNNNNNNNNTEYTQHRAQSTTSSPAREAICIFLLAPQHHDVDVDTYIRVICVVVLFSSSSSPVSFTHHLFVCASCLLVYAWLFMFILFLLSSIQRSSSSSCLRFVHITW